MRHLRHRVRVEQDQRRPQAQTRAPRGERLTELPPEVPSPWAEALRPGDEAAIAGPPGGRGFPYTHAHYVFAVDPTGLPAAGRRLEEEAPSHLPADVVVEIDHPDEAGYPLAERPGVKIHWVPRGTLAGEVLSLTVPADTFLFAAGEADSLRPLRSWPKSHAAIQGYWKHGEPDHEDH